MFPRISDLINYIFGSSIQLPVQTYGFFLALAFIIAGMVLSAELKRKEKEGLLKAINKQVLSQRVPVWPEIAGGALLSAVLGWKLIGIAFHYSEFSNDPQEYLLSAEGSLAAFFIILIISVVNQLINRRKAKKSEPQFTEIIIHPHQHTWNIVIIAIVAAIVGSKLFDIFDNFGDFLQNPISSLFSFSGLTFYGGLIVTVIVLLFYMKKIKLDWRYVIDCAAPAIMIGYAVGRLGCHFSGDGCWGIVNTLAKPGWMPAWLWSSTYPHNVINHGISIPGCIGRNCMELAAGVFPTSLYESLASALLFAVLWLSRKRIKAPVVLFGLYLVLNGCERFAIEKIRINHKYPIFGLEMSQAEIIASLLFFTGIGVMIYFSRKHHKTQETISNNQSAI